MSIPTYYDQDCPVCGRSLRIRVEYQGKVVMCRHCHGEFEAIDFVITVTESVYKVLSGENGHGFT